MSAFGLGKFGFLYVSSMKDFIATFLTCTDDRDRAVAGLASESFAWCKFSLLAKLHDAN